MPYQFTDEEQERYADKFNCMDHYPLHRRVTVLAQNGLIKLAAKAVQDRPGDHWAAMATGVSAFTKWLGPVRLPTGATYTYDAPDYWLPLFPSYHGYVNPQNVAEHANVVHRRGVGYLIDSYTMDEDIALADLMVMIHRQGRPAYEALHYSVMRDIYAGAALDALKHRPKDAPQSIGADLDHLAYGPEGGNLYAQHLAAGTYLAEALDTALTAPTFTRAGSCIIWEPQEDTDPGFYALSVHQLKAVIAQLLADKQTLQAWEARHGKPYAL